MGEVNPFRQPRTRERGAPKRTGTTVNGLTIFVSDHAMWMAAERFPRFDVLLIEEEVRAAWSAGRLSATREHLGLPPSEDTASLYAWTEDGRRVYALRVDRYNEMQFAVTTTMHGWPRRSP